MYLLIEYGGDLRLHDTDNRTPKTVALQQSNPNLRRKMLAFIEEARSNAKLQTCLKPNSGGSGNNTNSGEPNNLCHMQPKTNDELVNPCSLGFGIVNII
jgi:hypothetical protein